MELSTRRNTAIDKLIDRKCYVCTSLQPPYVHHCNICGQCVVMIDHHCPWINNCVGLYNQKVFFLFNLYGLVTMVYAGTLMGRHLVNELYGTDAVQTLDVTFPVVSVTLFMLTLAALFMLIVLCDQIVIILNRLSALDRVRLDQNRLKDNKVKKRGCFNFKYTFGQQVSWWWLVPVPEKRSITVESLY